MRADVVSPVSLAAIVAALHLAVLASRVSHRHLRTVTLMSWQMPTPEEPAPVATEPPSNPQRSYCAGQLALSVGMAVITLARQLHAIRASGARTY